ncbi:hypothetical protein MRX96_032425 [Rhipicephalus microplus]
MGNPSGDVNHKVITPRSDKKIPDNARDVTGEKLSPQQRLSPRTFSVATKCIEEEAKTRSAKCRDKCTTNGQYG